MATLDPSEIMFTPFEPKVQNRFIMYIEGVPAYLIKYAGIPSMYIINRFFVFGSNGVNIISEGSNVAILISPKSPFNSIQ